LGEAEAAVLVLLYLGVAEVLLHAFDFGFGYVTGNEKLSITFSGSYSFNEWTTPTWHERLKPSYYELQKYLQTYRDNEKSNKKGVTN
jgi:hypothetical protein